MTCNHVIKPSAIFFLILLLYRQYRRKQFIGFSPDQRFLTYTQTKVFYFDPDASGPGLNESDIICTINLPFIVCLHGMLTMQSCLLQPGHKVVTLQGCDFCMGFYFNYHRLELM